MHIRKGGTADVPALVRLGEEFWQSLPYQQKFEAREIEHLMLSLINQLGFILVIADENNEAQGMILVAITPWFLNRNVLTANELAWYVRPHARGHGKKLLQAAMRVARKKGVNLMTMVTLASGTEKKAAKIYEDLGFAKSETSYFKPLGR